MKTMIETFAKSVRQGHMDISEVPKPFQEEVKRINNEHKEE